jgi:protoporphyrinogen oxidase
MAPSGDKPRVAIVGGGIAGLSTAYFLGRAGVAVDLFEAEKETGGLAGSFNFDGQQVERYYHFICLPDSHLIDLAQELGVKDKINWRRTRTTFFYEGKLYQFTSPFDLLNFSPIPLRSRLNLGLETLKWKNLKDWERLDDISAKEWMLKSLGSQAYEVIWSPLLSMKFGEFQDQVSAAWLWHRVHRVANSRKSPFHPQVMGHFAGGTETLLKGLRGKISEQGGRIFCSAPVEAVVKKSDRVAGVMVSGQMRGYDSVVVTNPLPQAAALMPGELAEFSAGLRQVSFIGVVCLVLWIDRTISGAFWCNIHDKRVPFNGIIETSQLNLETARGGALIYVPHYLPVSAPRFSFPDEQLLDEFLKALPILKPGMSRESVKGFRVFRSKFAQPICPKGFRHLVPKHTTPLKGLFLIDCTQLYPEDRTISGTIGVSKNATALVLEHLKK